MSCSSSFCPVRILVLQRQESGCFQMPEPRLLLRYEALGLCGRAGFKPSCLVHHQGFAKPSLSRCCPSPPNPSAQQEWMDGDITSWVWLLGSIKPCQCRFSFVSGKIYRDALQSQKEQLVLPMCDTAMKSQPMISAGNIPLEISHFVSTKCETQGKPSQWKVLSAPTFTSLHLNSASAPPSSSY